MEVQVPGLSQSIYHCGAFYEGISGGRKSLEPYVARYSQTYFANQTAPFTPPHPPRIVLTTEDPLSCIHARRLSLPQYHWIWLDINRLFPLQLFTPVLRESTQESGPKLSQGGNRDVKAHRNTVLCGIFRMDQSSHKHYNFYLSPPPPPHTHTKEESLEEACRFS